MDPLISSTAGIFGTSFLSCYMHSGMAQVHVVSV